MAKSQSSGLNIPSQDVQERAVNQVSKTFTDYSNLSKAKRSEFLDIYQEVATFQENKRANWSVANKVNDIAAIIENIVPKIVSRSPKYILSKRTNSFKTEEFNQDPQLLEDSINAMQDYLFTVFDKYRQDVQIELAAASMITYGTCIGKVDYKYETATVTSKDGTKEEEVVGEYPTLTPKSWTNIYIDPRYMNLKEMPAIIEVEDGVRLGDLQRKKKKVVNGKVTGEYFNLDKVKDLADLEAFDSDEEYKNKVYSITGIQNISGDTRVDENALSMKIYYGYFSKTESDEDDGEERKYRITVVNDMVVIGFEEISDHPFVDFRAFLDPEQYYAQGVSQRLIGLQRDANFKMNSANDMINMGLNQMFYWSPISGVNPRDLVSRPGGIVPTKDTQMALQQVQPIDFKQVPSDYFQDRNDKNRSMQQLSHTVDTSNVRNQQALTNTATGARIQFAESNAVYARMRQRFEHSLEELGYKFLLTAFENIDNNIIIKKQGEEGFWGLNKEAFRNAINRYDIKVEANSSSFDTLDNRREEAIALFNTGLQGAQAGVNVDTDALFRNMIETFEMKQPDRFIKAPELQMQPEVTGTPRGVDQPEQQPSAAVQETTAIAGGDATDITALA